MCASQQLRRPAAWLACCTVPDFGYSVTARTQTSTYYADSIAGRINRPFQIASLDNNHQIVRKEFLASSCYKEESCFERILNKPVRVLLKDRCCVKTLAQRKPFHIEHFLFGPVTFH